MRKNHSKIFASSWYIFLTYSVNCLMSNLAKILPVVSNFHIEQRDPEKDREKGGDEANVCVFY